MLQEILDYMHDENIKVTQTNYKLQLLYFIGEGHKNMLNDSDFFEELLDEAMSVVEDEYYKNNCK